MSAGTSVTRPEVHYYKVIRTFGRVTKVSERKGKPISKEKEVNFMINYIFDPEEKEYITVTRPYPYSVGYHGKPLFPAEIYRRRAKLKVNLIPETKERGDNKHD